MSLLGLTARTSMNAKGGSHPQFYRCVSFQVYRTHLFKLSHPSPCLEWKLGPNSGQLPHTAHLLLEDSPQHTQTCEGSILNTSLTFGDIEALSCIQSCTVRYRPLCRYTPWWPCDHALPFTLCHCIVTVRAADQELAVWIVYRQGLVASMPSYHDTCRDITLGTMPTA